MTTVCIGTWLDEYRDASESFLFPISSLGLQFVKKQLLFMIRSVETILDKVIFVTLLFEIFGRTCLLVDVGLFLSDYAENTEDVIF